MQNPLVYAHKVGSRRIPIAAPVPAQPDHEGRPDSIAPFDGEGTGCPDSLKGRKENKA